MCVVHLRKIAAVLLMIVNNLKNKIYFLFGLLFAFMVRVTE